MSFEYEEKKPRSLKWKMIFSAILIALISLSVGGYVYLKRKTNFEKEQKEMAIQKVAELGKDTIINDSSRLVQQAKQQKESQVPLGVYAESENYKLVEVVFGGEQGAEISGEVKSIPLEISGARSETMVSKDGNNSTLLIYWKTNKLAKSKVIYRKSNAAAEKELNEEGIGISHALIIPKFEPDTRYLYKIVAEDRWGNKVESAEFAAYSGKKKDSIIDLITGEFRELFGWVIK